MPALKIRSESPAERCEICHQADRFDAFSNYCSRCEYKCSTIPIEQPRDRRDLLDGLIVVTVVVGLLIGIWTAIVRMNNYLLMVLLLFLMSRLCRKRI